MTTLIAHRSLIDHVATVELTNPPDNFFSVAMLEALATTLEVLDDDDACRAVLLCAEGKNFCAGADFSAGGPTDIGALYHAAVRLFRTRKPIVAAVQGAAVGGGLGLALAADFRIAAPEARFSANFARLGLHQGFGVSVTLPRVVGQQHAAAMLYTARRVPATDALAMGLVDRVVPAEELRQAALALAGEIATAAPLAVESIRATMRAGLADAVAAATDHELAEQTRLRETRDFVEGARATAERRTPHFERR